METSAPDPAELLLSALLLEVNGKTEEAAQRLAPSVSLHKDDIVLRNIAKYLQQKSRSEKSGSVYDHPDGFAAFISHGGNVDLYEAVANHMSVLYAEASKKSAIFSLLDVGVGNGMALVPALQRTERSARPVDIDLIEPSRDMLSETTAKLEALSVRARPFAGTLQDFVRQMGGDTRQKSLSEEAKHPEVEKNTNMIPSQRRWSLAQASFSLHNLSPEERMKALRWFRRHCERVAIFEFDVDASLAGVPFSLSRAQWIHSRYCRGMAEYENLGSDIYEKVCQGFLSPVFVGYFDKAHATHHETPVATWVEQLQEAGFEAVQTKLVHKYWWSDCYLILAC